MAIAPTMILRSLPFLVCRPMLHPLRPRARTVVAFPIFFTAVRAAAGSSSRPSVVRVVAAADDAGVVSKSNTGPVYKLVHTGAVRCLGLLTNMMLPAHLVTKAEKLKEEVNNVVITAEAGGPDKKACVMGLLRAAYDIVNLANECSMYLTAGAALPLDEVASVMISPDGKLFVKVNGTAVLKSDFGPAMENASAIEIEITDAVGCAIMFTSAFKRLQLQPK